MKTIELRQLFLNFFKQNKHEVVPSSPLVPGNDPTLLFTNSGMVQFKDVFLGTDKRSYKRAATSQRCVRAGGKHNDLENVGYTARHHTFFEMLGNFSFGDYFKKEAIHFAWTLLTEDIGLDPDRLWVTVYQDDDEAADVWLNEVGVPKGKFSRIDTSDNFWAMGDTGPCGPCSEIFFDHGPEVEGGPPGTPEQEGDRYIELWNLVFMQYERLADGTLRPLPKPSVDTGMGLERIAAVTQNVHSNYEIDLFKTLIQAAANIVNSKSEDNKSLRVIADHIRSAAFLVVDGITPSNENRGYVLRRIIRRAIRHGYQLGCREPFMHKLTSTLVAEMGDAYPELSHARKKVENVLLKEGERFAITLDQGIKVLEREMTFLSGTELSGDVAFRLYDTYGFPLDLTADYLREQNLSVDFEGFDAAMQEQRSRAKASSKFGVTSSNMPVMELNVTFNGYDQLDHDGVIKAIISDGNEIDVIEVGDEAILIFESTPFYAESGGQVGDKGIIYSGDNEFIVNDAQYVSGKVTGHIGKVAKGRFLVGDTVHLQVDAQLRTSTRNNHSATHLMHSALMDVLGSHVQQRGSLVAPDRLRFDFTHDSALSFDEIKLIEMQVNDAIQSNWQVKTVLMDLDKAKAEGAAALFGEKYDSTVRTVRMGNYSFELCGGTHVAQTGDIGLFKIVQESSISSGVRRIEALTGCEAISRMQQESALLTEIARRLQTGVIDVRNKVEQIVENNRLLERQVSELKTQLATGGSSIAKSSIKKIGDVQLHVSRHDNIDIKDLRTILDRMQQQIKSGVVVLGSVNRGKATLICSVSNDLTHRFHAGKLIATLAAIVDGNGGGKPHLAQGGGAGTDKIDSALDSVESLIA